MDQGTFEVSNKLIISLCKEVMASKGKAYTIGSSDRLANFYKTAQEVGISPMQVWATFFAKQTAALMQYAKDPNAPQSEPIMSRFIDVLAYTQLGWALAQEIYGLQPEEAVHQEGRPSDVKLSVEAGDTGDATHPHIPMPGLCHEKPPVVAPHIESTRSMAGWSGRLIN